MGTDPGTSCWVSSPPLGRPLGLEREPKAPVVGIVSQRASKSGPLHPKHSEDPGWVREQLWRRAQGRKLETKLPEQRVL